MSCKLIYTNSNRLVVVIVDILQYRPTVESALLTLLVVAVVAFSSIARILGRMFDHSFPACAYFF